MKKLNYLFVSIIGLLLSGCSTSPIKTQSLNTTHPATHTPIIPIQEVYYFDVSAGEKCRLTEKPSIKNKKLSLKPLIDNNGDWICESKPVIYKVVLTVKNIEKVTRNYELECDNPYGLMRECKGWGQWLTEMGPGPYIIESNGLPEVKPKPSNPNTENKTDIRLEQNTSIDDKIQKIEK